MRRFLAGTVTVAVLQLGLGVTTAAAKAPRPESVLRLAAHDDAGFEGEPAPEQTLRHWRQLVRTIRRDPIVLQHWNDVRSDRSRSWALIGFGIAYFVMALGGGIALSFDEDDPVATGVLATGLTMGAGTITAGAFTMPSRGDYDAVVDHWNRRHPESPLRMGF